MFPTVIQDAIDSPADFSSTFTEKVDAIRAALQEVVCVQVTHQNDMNYSYGQRLSFCLDVDGRPTTPEQAKYEVQVYVSSKANLFAIYNLFRAGTNEWRPISEAELPAASGNPIRLSETKLNSMGYQRVEDHQLSQEASGHFTEMDGAPATVFEVLFSELA